MFSFRLGAAVPIVVLVCEAGEWAIKKLRRALKRKTVVPSVDQQTLTSPSSAAVLPTGRQIRDTCTASSCAVSPPSITNAPNVASDSNAPPSEAVTAVDDDVSHVLPSQDSKLPAATGSLLVLPRSSLTSLSGGTTLNLPSISPESQVVAIRSTTKWPSLSLPSSLPSLISHQPLCSEVRSLSDSCFLKSFALHRRSGGQSCTLSFCAIYESFLFSSPSETLIETPIRKRPLSLPLLPTSQSATICSEVKSFSDNCFQRSMFGVVHSKSLLLLPTSDSLQVHHESSSSMMQSVSSKMWKTKEDILYRQTYAFKSTLLGTKRLSFSDSVMFKTSCSYHCDIPPRQSRSYPRLSLSLSSGYISTSCSTSLPSSLTSILTPISFTLSKQDVSIGSFGSSDSPATSFEGDSKCNYLSCSSASASRALPAIPVTLKEQFNQINSTNKVPEAQKSLKQQEKKFSQEKDEQTNKVSQEKDEQTNKVSQEKDEQTNKVSQEKDKQTNKVSQEKDKQTNKVSQEKDEQTNKVSQEKDEQTNKVSQEKDEQTNKVSQEKDEQTNKVSQEKEEQKSHEQSDNAMKEVALAQKPPAENAVKKVAGTNKPLYGLVGLKNTGNSCYLNAVLQCLSHTRKFTEYFLAERGKRDKACTGGKTSKVIEALTDFLEQLWIPKDRKIKAIAPYDLRSALELFIPIICDSEQEDAQEFLGYLLCCLHGEINNSKEKPPDIPINMNAKEQAVHAWKVSSAIDNSVLSRLFMGQSASSLSCLKCKNISVSFEPFWNLSLPLPSPKTKHSSNDHVVSMHECFKIFSAEEKLSKDNQRFCKHCNTLQSSLKKMTVQVFPEILILQLKRFTLQGQMCIKLTSDVHIPTTLTVEEIATDKGSTKSFQYELYAIINHIGSISHGHYIAQCKNKGKWFSFNDESVTPYTNNISAPSPLPYVIFYEKKMITNQVK